MNWEENQWRSKGPAGPAIAGGPWGLKGPPGRSSRRTPWPGAKTSCLRGGGGPKIVATLLSKTHLFSSFINFMTFEGSRHFQKDVPSHCQVLL